MQQLKGMTTLDSWAASYNVLCDCGRENIQVYYCDVETCPDHEQKFFCVECSTEDLKHTHKKVQIKKELESKMKEWQTVLMNVNYLNQVIDNNFPQYEHLIKYLDHEDLHKKDLTVKSPSRYVS
jgi:hypothetical protein